MNKKTTAKQTPAREAYLACLASIEAQVKILNRVLYRHAKLETTWAHVGDLGRIETGLKDLLDGFHDNLKN